MSQHLLSALHSTRFFPHSSRATLAWIQQTFYVHMGFSAQKVEGISAVPCPTPCSDVPSTAQAELSSINCQVSVEAFSI